ncbi:uncharacterized protein LOC108916376 [Anoplophora glabripennis]|uniref:uncharacterized protein LOC108916376 n=1 Tax=Anoplophora glabripennis TaxID=217634 RepID=UPI000874C1D7|nr:uncharacterized protein LOC108916376 [Anoplophora glabripennis]
MTLDILDLKGVWNSFPKTRRFVHKYTAACLNCAYAKGAQGRSERFLDPYEKKAIPLDTVHIDHIGPYVKSVKQNSYLLVVVDAFTKYMWAKPTKTLSSAETIEKLRWLFGEFGYPRRIFDRGLAFTNRAFANFVGDRGIKHVENAIGASQANGQAERANLTIIEAYTCVLLSNVRDYKRFSAVIAVEALRRYQSGAIHVGDESDDSLGDYDRDQSSRQVLIDLLES